MSELATNSVNDLNIIDIPPETFKNNHRIIINGTRNNTKIRSNTSLFLTINIQGHDNVISIGENCMLFGSVDIMTNSARLSIGDATTSMGLRITMHEAETISIGRDCMFSGGIWMDCSDIHSIIDVESQQRINPPLPIRIADHVWVGHNVTVLKGAVIESNSIIAAGAVVTGRVPSGSVAAGVPARVVRSGVTWDRRRLPW